MPTGTGGRDCAYRLDQLGWFQFERLCTLLIELESGTSELAWHGRAEHRREAFFDEGKLALPTLGVTVSGPAMVAIIWIPAGGRREDRVMEFDRRIAGLLNAADPRAHAQCLLTLTNLDREDAGRAPLVGTRAGRGVLIIGASELGCCLDARAELRFAMPSALGLRDLTALIDAGARARSSLDVENAHELAEIFVPTHAYERARKVLARHRFVVLTGPPEMGKTAIAKMLALAALTDGWEAHECTQPQQIWRVFDPGRRQVFVADDAFGSTEYRADAAELWARDLGRLLGALDERHWLIWTSRPAPLRAGLARVQRERGSERFPSPGEVLVDASDLSLAEKTLILFRHAKHAGKGADAVRAAGPALVEHPYFTPERIRRFVSERLTELIETPDLRWLIAAVDSELSTPTQAMQTSFTALGEEHRAVLIALLDTPAGLVDERELVAAVRRHHPAGLSRPPDQLIDRLTDHFLRAGTAGIDWVHPSWRDLVIDELRSDREARQRFLGSCSLYGAMLALSVQGGRSGERAFPLLIVDADWDLLTDTVGRLLGELDDHDLARLFQSSLAAIKSGMDLRSRLELESLVQWELSTAQRRWDADKRLLPVFVVEVWFELSAALPETLDPPNLLPSWVELHPGVLDRACGIEELARTEEWLALAETLGRYAPERLQALGFPERDMATLKSVTDAALAIALASETHSDHAKRIAGRAATLSPDLTSSDHAIAAADLATVERGSRWWTPEDIPTPPSTELASVQVDFDREDIESVLADL